MIFDPTNLLLWAFVIWYALVGATGFWLLFSYSWKRGELDDEKFGHLIGMGIVMLLVYVITWPLWLLFTDRDTLRSYWKDLGWRWW